jgi:hypothetical protein
MSNDISDWQMPGELNGKELRSGQGFKERRQDLGLMKSIAIRALFGNLGSCIIANSVNSQSGSIPPSSCRYNHTASRR